MLEKIAQLVLGTWRYFLKKKKIDVLPKSLDAEIFYRTDESLVH